MAEEASAVSGEDQPGALGGEGEHGRSQGAGRAQADEGDDGAGGH